ncbi:multidrug resistance-associated protein [Trypanosoma cruzi]|nr:multidrug resistance-associated protein [Trypanosoma cruzi]
MSRKEQESVTTTVYAVRLVHAVVLWLAVVFFGISVVFLKRRLPRATPISFYFCCLLGIGGVFVSALYQLAGPRSARGGGGGIFWVTWAGLVCWLLLLMRSVRHANLPDVLFVFLLLALVGMECTGIVLQFISTRSRIADILMDAFIAVPHMLVFVTLVGWDWLMVNDIALVFRENTPIEGDRYEGNNKDDDDDDDGGLGHVHDKKPHAFFCFLLVKIFSYRARPHPPCLVRVCALMGTRPSSEQSCVTGVRRTSCSHSCVSCMILVDFFRRIFFVNWWTILCRRKQVERKGKMEEQTSTCLLSVFCLLL